MHDPIAALAEHGAVHLPGAAERHREQLLSILGALPTDRAGVRIGGMEALRPLLSASGAIGRAAAAHLGSHCRPVRAILFDKTADRNWSLGWHQDRTICVERRHDAPGFGPWTVKHGILHVAPPFSVLERMLTLRVHLDDVPAANAPLLIAPGSHREGRIPVGDVAAVVQRCGSRACLAAAGDIWLYATAVLHASPAATAPARRRVLQIDYAAEQLPAGLLWKTL